VIGTLPTNVPRTIAAAFRIPALPGDLWTVDVTPAKSLDPPVQDALKRLLASYFHEHAGSISFDFAQLAPQQESTDSWLDPAAMKFSLGTDAGLRTPLLILGSLSKPAPEAPESLAFCVPQNSSCCYVLSLKVVMEHLIAPFLAKTFGRSPADFAYDRLGKCLTFTGSIDAGHHQVGAIWYYPRITTVKAILVGQVLQIEVSGSCDMGVGIVMDFGVRLGCLFTFDSSRQAIRFDFDPNALEKHNSDVPLWLKIITLDLVDLILSWITESLSRSIANFELQCFQMAPIINFARWSGLPTAKITHAVLNDALVLTGSF
jgi:hypothetical protein